MICPLLTGECAKEKCAWWVEGKEGCGVRVIAEALDELEEQGINVYQKE